MTRLSYYTEIHKSIRRLMALFSISLGNCDLHNENQHEKLKEDFSQLKNFLEQHSHHEDNYFNPLLANCKPQMFQEIKQHHDDLEQQLNKFEDTFLTWLHGKSDTDQNNICLEYNYLLAKYFQHMHDEETLIMPAFWEFYTDEQLMVPLQQMFQACDEEQVFQWYIIMLPAFTPNERNMYLQRLSTTVKERLLKYYCNSL